MSALTYPTRTAMVRNILREYRATDVATRLDGAGWYASAQMIAMTIALETGLALEQAIGVIAALSPQQQWWQNVMLARQAAEAGVMVQGHTTDNMRKVNEILQGADPLDVLGGLKVRSFYVNILEAGTDDGVTIDRHAWRTVCGRHELGQRSAVPTDKAYQLAVDAFQQAARHCEGITAAQLQAIVWIPRAA
jgi:hypothetical protein